MLKIEHANIRLDRYPIPVETWQWQECWGEVRQFFPRYYQPSATIHLFVRNDGNTSVEITQVGYNGEKISKVSTTAEFAGTVIWYRVNPELLQPGQMGMIYVRLRNTPTKPIEVSVTTKDGQTVTTRLSGSNYEQMRLGYIGFNREINKIYVYVERFTERSLDIDRVYLDGKDVIAVSEIINGSFIRNPALVEISLDKPLVYLSYHCIKVTSRQGPIAMYQIRVRDDQFLLGIVAGQTPLKEYHAKFFNMLYSCNGSHPMNPNWWDENSKEAKMGFTILAPSPSEEAVKAGATVPPGRIMYGNNDEPDAHEPPGLPFMERCGINIMREVEPTMRMQRRLDPYHETALMIDRTYAPLNWFHYGEVPDVVFNDIYCPTQWQGEDLGILPITIDVLTAASGPRPAHIMLWGTMNTGYPILRSPTPEENDMSVHYVIGSGAKGLHYFLDWNSYPTVAEGGYYIGAPRTNMLWKNMGRMNAEITRIATLLSTGYPFNIVETDNDMLWARSLLCGKDNIVVVLVNRNHRIYDNVSLTKMPHIFPVKGATMTINLPEWFDPTGVFHVSWDEVRSVNLSGQGNKRQLQIPELKTSMVLVLSQDSKIEEKLNLDTEQLASLLESEKSRFVTAGPAINNISQTDAIIHLDMQNIERGSLKLDLTDSVTLDRALRICTEGELRVEPGKWLGLFTRPDWHGEAEIVFRFKSPIPLKKIGAELKSSTPNFAACANNVVGVSLDNKNYVEDCSFKMNWNGGWSGEQLKAIIEAPEGQPITVFYVHILLRDPGIVASDEATNLAENLRISWTGAE